MGRSRGGVAEGEGEVGVVRGDEIVEDVKGFEKKRGIRKKINE